MGLLYIFLEYLIIENFIINFLILYLTKIISRSQGKPRRIIIGAFIASLYSLVFFLPSHEFLLSILGKMLVALIIIRVSFLYINYKIFIRTIIAFYLTSFIFAGATLGALFTQSDNCFLKGLDFGRGSFPLNLLIMGVIISFISGKLIFKYFNTRIMRENYIADVIIHYNQNKIKIRALMDTGNTLKEPLTKRKVMVVDYKALEKVLPKAVKELLKANDKGDFIEVERQMNLLMDDFYPTLIPYKSVGVGSTIIGFTPDLIEIYFNDYEKTSRDIVIGLYSGSLTDDMGYSGLLNFEMSWGDLDEVNEIQS